MDENAKKRVALAEDVLARISNGLISAYSGSYFAGQYPDGSCEVCALGALVVACCGFPRDMKRARRQGEDVVLECLRPIFDDRQIVMIEAAFERVKDPPTAVATRVYLSEEQLACVGQFGRNADDSDDRLRLIMQNIIDHNGTFVPEAP